MNDKINELEKNINISLQNIKENGISGNSGKHRESGDGEDWTNKGGKYGFNKEYKLEPNDHHRSDYVRFDISLKHYSHSAGPAWTQVPP